MGKNLVHSVGEIYVIPENNDEASSGLLGAMSRLNFFVLSNGDEVYSVDARFYPNPVSNALFFSNVELQGVYVFDAIGRLEGIMMVNDNRLDLSHLTDGTYLLKPLNPEINSFKILKK